jgi:hypothetical protein
MSDGRAERGPLHAGLSRELVLESDVDLIGLVLHQWQGGRQQIAALAPAVRAAVFTMLQVFRVAAGQTARVPLLVATDSFLPDLGYAIPAGDWGVQATLDPALGHAGRTPILPITVQP